MTPLVFGGRSTGGTSSRDMVVHAERAATLAARISRLIALRSSRRAERKIGIVIFNFPPNAGNTGSAAYLAVFESLFNTLAALREVVAAGARPRPAAAALAKLTGLGANDLYRGLTGPAE